jgi:hyaluronan synthase
LKAATDPIQSHAGGIVANSNSATRALEIGTAPIGDRVDRLLLGLIFAGITIFALAIFQGVYVLPMLGAVAAHGWMAFLLRPSLLWLSMGMVLLLLRTVLWARYKPSAAATGEDAPSLTVIIPAYNEGAMVARSIDSCVAADYPADRIEILVIDDGSRDDTWTQIESAARRHAGRVTALRFPLNRGKRAALAEGFRRARGDIVVTIDSDSVIEAGSLLAIAGPFRDARVGAVAGKVCVLNRFDGWLPRMLHVRFVLSFDFLRSVQSGYGTVYCCPGALSAYRHEAVMRILESWEGQTFLGVPCTIGEDRALTNDILALGYDAVYQRTAVVHTIAPETYGKLCRMYLRWDRSYVREELRLAKILWRRPPLAMLMTVIEKTLTNLRYPVAYASLAMLAGIVLHDPWAFVRLLISIGLVSSFYMLYYLRSERSWEFLYGIAYAYFSLFSLMWIFPTALLTARRQGWLTR